MGFSKGSSPMAVKVLQAQVSSSPTKQTSRLQGPAPGRQLPRLLGGRGHLRGDEGLDDAVVGWQQVAVAVVGVGALVHHQTAGRHCGGQRSC